MFPAASLLDSAHRPITPVITAVGRYTHMVSHGSRSSYAPRAWSRAARGVIRHANDMRQ